MITTALLNYIGLVSSILSLWLLYYAARGKHLFGDETLHWCMILLSAVITISTLLW